MMSSSLYLSTPGQEMKEVASLSPPQEAAYRISSHIHLWSARAHKAHATTSPTYTTFGSRMWTIRTSALAQKR